MRVIFIGGLTNGKIVYDYLKSNTFVELVLAITHIDNPSTARYAKFEPDNGVIFSNSANEYLSEIKSANADLIVVAGWSELLSNDVLLAAKDGVIGFHPSRLPMDKGRSVLAWQIEEGYSETALTMFYYNNVPDGGDIIAQELIVIDPTDYINDILNKVDKAIYNLMVAYFPLIRQYRAPRLKQDPNEGVFRRLRRDRDSIIDWDQPSKTILNKIRAISHPYPGAIASLIDNDNHIRIWRAESIDDFSIGKDTLCGTLVAKIYNNSLIVKTRTGFILITEYDWL